MLLQHGKPVAFWKSLMDPETQYANIEQSW